MREAPLRPSIAPHRGGARRRQCLQRPLPPGARGTVELQDPWSFDPIGYADASIGVLAFGFGRSDLRLKSRPIWSRQMPDPRTRLVRAAIMAALAAAALA